MWAWTWNGTPRPVSLTASRTSPAARSPSPAMPFDLDHQLAASADEVGVVGSDRRLTYEFHSAEPAVAKTGGGRMTAVLRTGPFKPFHQVFSEDGGKSWSPPVLLRW